MVNVKYAHNYWTELGSTFREGDADILLTRREMEEFRDRKDMPGHNRYVKLVKGIRELEIAYGDGIKKVTEAEKKVRKKLRGY